MQSATIETLRNANRTLAASLNCLRRSTTVASPVIRQEEFCRLRKEIGLTVNTIRSVPSNWIANGELQELISAYRENLQQLARILPLIHGALRARRERLKTALDHLHSVAEWADTNGKSL